MDHFAIEQRLRKIHNELYFEFETKIRWLLDTHKLWSEEGTYTFPDGDIWYEKR